MIRSRAGTVAPAGSVKPSEMDFDRYSWLPKPSFPEVEPEKVYQPPKSTYSEGYADGYQDGKREGFKEALAWLRGK